MGTLARSRRSLKALLPPGAQDVLYRARDVAWYYKALRTYGGRPRLASVASSLRSAFLPERTILFYPGRPTIEAVEYLYCALLGYGITNHPGRRHAAAFKRADATLFDPALLEPIVPTERWIINRDSLDIGKSTSARAFAEVFGYELAVDPLTHVGPMVEKSDENYAKDGRILEGPLRPEDVRPGMSYQRLIAGRASPDEPIVEYRIPILGDEIPLVYRKHRADDARFVANASMALEETGDVCTPEEVGRLLALARRMGLDFGEYDALRDADGRLYVVDVNNTPTGPISKISPADAARAYGVLKHSFARLAAVTEE